MQPKLTYEVGADDLRRVLAETIETDATNKAYDRYYATFINLKTAAHIHNISHDTMSRYVADGHITPEPTDNKKEVRFRLSEILKLDVSKLKYKRK